MLQRLIAFFADTASIIRFSVDTWGRSAESVYEAGGAQFFVRKNTSDIYVIHEVFTDHMYGTDITGTVVDIGANIGAFSIFASKTADQVYSFEPESENYTQLTKNIELNNAKNITPAKLAVGAADEDITLFKAENNKGATSSIYHMSHNTEIVPMRSLETLCQEFAISSIDFLKIDIEGGEYDLIDAAPSSLLHHIQCVVLEYHFVPGRSSKDIMTRLENEGFVVRRIRTLRSLFLGTGIIRAERV